MKARSPKRYWADTLEKKGCVVCVPVYKHKECEHDDNVPVYKHEECEHDDNARTTAALTSRDFRRKGG